MAKDEFRELHELLFKIMGLFHAKFIRKFCTESPNHPELKKIILQSLGSFINIRFLLQQKFQRCLIWKKVA